jgi:hypothetical protein
MSFNKKRGIGCIVVRADAAGDSTSNDNLISYASMLSGKGLLRRVLIDECHLIITSSDWRPKLALLKNLRLLPCPMVLLTPTLPPVREDDLGTSNKHVTSVRDVRPSEHCAAVYAVLSIVVRARQGSGDGANDISTIAADTTRQWREGGSVLPQQVAVRRLG